jgi:predicted nucleotidyltransferase
MSLSRDFVEFIECLNERRVEYLLIGGYALAFHGWPRFTKDIDFWISPSRGNAEQLLEALEDFGFKEMDLSADDFCLPGKVVQLGMPPVRIDLVTSVTGLEFEAAYARRIESEYEGVSLTVIHLEDLIANKRAVGRPQDLLDLEKIEENG